MDDDNDDSRENSGASYEQDLADIYDPEDDPEDDPETG